ncbi:copper chaperone PCu(A)C [Burkholderia metallica]|uniref:copper chaperone PCu(A)C n=1 Tax=Burkholderia metallica TaxID=488729 RepID=UPI0008420B11|nr:copper chaperone PCu(A)C [Burkholderia metallica]AOJ33546.1 copper transporter [Burkholderia metallica]MCA8000122.1 copper chaperone PCu(A)C [Burkholderia metallica]
MNITKKTLATLAYMSVAALSPVAHAAPAQSVAVSDCWIRGMPGNLPSGGFFNVKNSSDNPIDLTGVDSDAFGMAMLHQTQSNGSTSTMVMVDKATVPAGGTLSFAPGGYHVMLEQPTHPLKVGTTLPLTFTFGDGEKVTAQCTVKAPGTMAK